MSPVNDLAGPCISFTADTRQTAGPPSEYMRTRIRIQNGKGDVDGVLLVNTRLA